MDDKRYHLMQKVAFGGFLLCMAGLPTSPAVLSIGTVTMILPAFAALPLRQQWQKFRRDPAAWLLALILVVQVLSWFWTENKEQWVNQVRVKLPLLFGLYSLSVLGPFSQRWVRIGFMVLSLAACVTGTATVIDYLIHREQIEMQIQVSKPMELVFEVNHIYFSIIMAFTVLACFWLWRSREIVFHRLERPLMLVIGLANMGIMHVLTARTGLLAFYLAALALGVWFLLRQKKYLFALLVVVGITSLPVLGYYSVSSLRHRIDNTFMDIDRYFNGDDPNYLSIGMRFESWKAAIHLFQAHPMIGVGMGDLEYEMDRQYLKEDTNLHDENFVLPHNQFIQTMAGLGLLGLLPLLLGWVYPAIRQPGKKHWLFFGFWIILGFGMMGESVLERQVGVMLVVTLLMATRWIEVSVQKKEHRAV